VQQLPVLALPWLLLLVLVLVQAASSGATRLQVCELLGADKQRQQQQQTGVFE
jgi:hypothetical protein